MLLALWSGFWDWGGSPSVPDTHDGGFYVSAVEYRKNLERIAEITEIRAAKKSVQKVIKKLKKAPPAVVDIIKPQLEAVYDYSIVNDIALDIQNIIKQLNLEIARIEQQRIQEEEEFLMLLQFLTA